MHRVHPSTHLNTHLHTHTPTHALPHTQYGEYAFVDIITIMHF